MRGARPTGGVPYVTREQMVEVDRVMIDDYRIELVQMMENAGRNLAHLARTRFLDGDPRGRRVVALAGTGGNGGGALVAARRLHNWGADVAAFLATPGARLGPVPAHQLDILVRMGVSTHAAAELANASDADLILDGVIGYSLRGAPYGSAATMIAWANAHPAPTLSLDVPSGVDIGKGVAFEPAIRATATMTLALPKEGLRARRVAAYVGELYLADIGVPPELYAEPGLKLDVGPLFAEAEILRLS